MNSTRKIKKQFWLTEEEARSPKQKAMTAGITEAAVIKYDGHCHVKVDIYFTAMGMMDIPTENEIRAMLKKYRKIRWTSNSWHSKRIRRSPYRRCTVSLHNYFLIWLRQKRSFLFIS